MSRVVLSCEHARADLPPGFQPGLAPAELQGHLAWDPGAVEVAHELALALGAPLVAGTVSRLLVDLNRRVGDPGLVPARSFGTEVPGNQGLSAAELERRVAAFHAPYRRSLQAEVAAAVAQGGCVHLSVHSYTPVLGASERRYDLGLLFDPGREAEVRLARLLQGALRTAGFDARLNEPYLGVDEGCTTWLREQHDGSVYAGLELEISQRLDALDRRRVAQAVQRVLQAL